MIRKNNNIFQDVVGQKHLTEKFSRIIPSGRLHHAYILSGNEGSGREAFALEIIKIINCAKNKEGDFSGYCGICDSCKIYSSHPEEDLLYIYPDPLKKSDNDKKISEYRQMFNKELDYKVKHKGYSNFSFGKGNYITIDKIRCIRNFKNYNSLSGSFRAVFIVSADLMNKEAQNSLLKILEEPPQNFIFFLITERPGNLLTTIHSRTQHLKFTELSPIECTRIIERIYCEKYEKSRVSELALFAEGSYKRILDSLNTGEDKIQTAYDYFSAYFKAEIYEVSNKIDQLQSFLKERLSLDEVKLLFSKIKKDYVRAFYETNNFNHNYLEKFSTEINDLLYMYQRNINPKLIFLNFYLNHHKAG